MGPECSAAFSHVSPASDIVDDNPEPCNSHPLILAIAFPPAVLCQTLSPHEVVNACQLGAQETQALLGSLGLWRGLRWLVGCA